jgi:hypothetical protein
MRGDIREFCAEMRLRQLRANALSDFRWLIGGIGGSFIILLGTMAHGFRWF